MGGTRQYWLAAGPPSTDDPPAASPAASPAAPPAAPPVEVLSPAADADADAATPLAR